jgi:hypothetical protein
MSSGFGKCLQGSGLHGWEVVVVDFFILLYWKY